MPIFLIVHVNLDKNFLVIVMLIDQNYLHMGQTEVAKRGTLNVFVP